MNHNSYFYNCSKEYIESINTDLYSQITDIITKLNKRDTQSDINNDFFWLLVSSGWSFDSLSGVSEAPPADLKINTSSSSLQFKENNNRALCKTTSTIEADWHSDFAKTYTGKLVQLEVQFGKVESMFKDFCGFKIANYENRLSLGIEIVMSEPAKYFSHRKSAISGMAYLDIAKNTLSAIGLNCPIWLIGIKE